MKTVQIKGIRFCTNCREETEHMLIYYDYYLKAGKCLVCGEEFNNRENLLRVYSHDMVERILSKPIRVYKELQHLPGNGRVTLNICGDALKRLLSKPFKEIRNLNQIWRKYKF